MNLVANNLNNVFFQNILPSDNDEVDCVLAAIAYGSEFNNGNDLLTNCLKKNLRLDIWMRYDHTVPVSVPLLRRFYDNQLRSIYVKFIPDCLHSKVVWWKGYGTYIGSANHTDRAWVTNIELGVFIPEEEMEKSGLDIELNSFFEELRANNKSIDLTEDYINHNNELAKLNKNQFKESEKARKWPVWGGPAYVDKKKSQYRQKVTFRSEWNSTLGVLKNIEKKVIEHKPIWIEKNVPAAWQADQFLHAYYYNHVGERRAKPYEAYYENNKKISNSVLIEELQWWGALKAAPTNEHEMLHVNAPLLHKLLNNEKILSITLEDFELVCRNTHATGAYVIKLSTALLGKPESIYLSQDDRYPLFAKMIYSQKNKQGWNILKLLNYVFYEGKDVDLWERLYNAGRTSEYRIPNYGLNSIAELVGWVRPEVAPPRNGRTSKALRAMGFDVKIYS